MFVWPVRVYYEDTDSGGVVYHANYLKFMERARTEWLRSLGFEQDALIRHEGVIFAVHHMTLAFLRPARFNDLLEVSVVLAERGAASLVFRQAVLPGGAGGDAGRGSGKMQEEKPEKKSEMKRKVPRAAFCEARVRIACLDAMTLRPRRIPQPLLREIASEC